MMYVLSTIFELEKPNEPNFTDNLLFSQLKTNSFLDRLVAGDEK